MPAYLVAQISVHDPAGFEAYRTNVMSVLAAHGGRYLIRGGALEVLEGSASQRRMVVIEFPSMEAARAFYRSDAYAPVLQQRLASATADIVLVEGWAPD